MNIEKLEKKIQSLTADLTEETFIYELLQAYELPKASITRLKKGDYNLAKGLGEILWKKKLYFKREIDSDLHGLIDEVKNDPAVTRHQPRFIVVTDFQTLLALDSKTDDTLDIPIRELARHYDFFLPWAGMEKAQLQSENPADIKAAERMGRLYDIICEENPAESAADRHNLNIFLSRLLFCFFAEDTGIFSEDQFTRAVASHTALDGHDLQAYLEKLFRVLSVEDREGYPQYLQNFPYVNGGLFCEEYPVPQFSARSRKIIVECGELNWKEINPDIFGSMIQAVIHTEQRANLGMHYTSVVNIMKVMEPLFLNDLYDELEKAGTSKKKLQALLERLKNIRIFDPACGSGNFLIIAYKELCRLEIEIFKRLYGGQQTVYSVRIMSNIRLTQFYGIELDDFAHETAKLSLWLAEHQMNLAFKEVFGDARPTLPLQDGGHIVCGNATRLDWEDVCPKYEGAEIYILGNPPYLGGKFQSKDQKKDMAHTFKGLKKFGELDYIACWFIKSSQYIANSDSQFSFVTTSSVCQGAQVHQLWPLIFNLNLEIKFAYKPFKWSNNAKSNAKIICTIIGIINKSNVKKYLYDAGRGRQVSKINAYLTSARNCIIYPSLKTISAALPKIITGNSPYDGGNLLLSPEEKNNIVSNHPNLIFLIKRIHGSKDFLNGKERWCLWIENSQIKMAYTIPEISSRIEKTKKFRENGGEVARGIANRPHQFRYTHTAKNSLIIIPRVSSVRRKYIPFGFLDKDHIVSDSAQAIYDPPPYIFAVISSRIHMTWVRTVAGRLKTDYRYSSALCYNTFPFPDISESQKNTLEEHVFNVLDAREQHSEKTMAQLYDPDKMPDGLRRAHHEMDLAVERCYRSRPFKNDEERLEYLFQLYEKMIEEEKSV